MSYQVLKLQDAAVANGYGNVLTLLTVDEDPMRHVSVQVDGITDASVYFEVSNDGVGWYDQALHPSDDLAASHKNTIVDGIFVGEVYARFFRAQISAYVSGTITVLAVAS